MSQSQVQTNRNYLATFILDTRGYEEPIENLVDVLTQAIVDLGGTVDSTENLGRQDFVRVTDKKHTADYYVKIVCSGSASLSVDLSEKFRLDRRIKRLLLMRQD